MFVAALMLQFFYVNHLPDELRLRLDAGGVWLLLEEQPEAEDEQTDAGDVDVICCGDSTDGYPVYLRTEGKPS